MMTPEAYALRVLEAVQDSEPEARLLRVNYKNTDSFVYTLILPNEMPLTANVERKMGGWRELTDGEEFAFAPTLEELCDAVCEAVAE